MKEKERRGKKNRKKKDRISQDGIAFEVAKVPHQCYAHTAKVRSSQREDRKDSFHFKLPCLGLPGQGKDCPKVQSFRVPGPGVRYSMMVTGRVGFLVNNILGSSFRYPNDRRPKSTTLLLRIQSAAEHFLSVPFCRIQNIWAGKASKHQVPAQSTLAHVTWQQ